LAVAARCRPDNDGLFLLEAIVDGVRIFRLDHRLDFYRETAKIAIRRLEVNRTPEMLQALADFAQEIAGKPYCSLLDIVKTYGTGVRHHRLLNPCVCVCGGVRVRWCVRWCVRRV
jgi:hypothetical protein